MGWDEVRVGADLSSQYAIRQNIRHNKELRSEDLIKKVASLVDERHKVNLSKPDKVILVEVFQVRYPFPLASELFRRRYRMLTNES
jgi:tRNA(Ser,Leu) C12 N-acetylase TAN1